jgi:hypothetical protein
MAALDSKLLMQSVKGHKMTTLLAIILHDEHLLSSELVRPLPTLASLADERHTPANPFANT